MLKCFISARPKSMPDPEALPIADIAYQTAFINSSYPLLHSAR